MLPSCQPLTTADVKPQTTHACQGHSSLQALAHSKPALSAASVALQMQRQRSNATVPAHTGPVPHSQLGGRVDTRCSQRPQPAGSLATKLARQCVDIMHDCRQSWVGPLQGSHAATDKSSSRPGWRPLAQTCGVYTVENNLSITQPTCKLIKWPGLQGASRHDMYVRM